MSRVRTTCSFLLALLTIGTAEANDRRVTTTRPLTRAEARLLGDPPASHLAATRAVAPDTTWFGGVDESGIAIEGGVWDFEDGTLQEWTSIDLNDIPTYFRRVTTDDCVTHGDPVCPVINGSASLWVGVHQDEAEAMCWPGGQGYGNFWVQGAAKTFSYTGTGTVTLDFDYFSDALTIYDLTYVYTRVNGVLSTPLNTSTWASFEGWGYSGAVDDGTPIGSPDDPAHDTIVIDPADLPVGAGEFEVLFQFESEVLISDALDGFSGFFNSRHGPFGADDISVSGDGLSDLSDFETGLDGWVPERFAGPGPLLAAHLLDDLEPLLVDTCGCSLEGTVMTVASLDAPAHPYRHREQFQSPPIYVGPGSGVAGIPDRVLLWDMGEIYQSGVAYRPRVSYYPWTCPITGAVGWTPVPAGDRSYNSVQNGCGTYLREVEDVPASVDSLKITFDLLSDCRTFGAPDCDGPSGTNETPYFDNVRLGVLLGGVDAPSLSVDLTYQDGFARDNTLLPAATADVHTFYDLHRADGDPSNALLGDSVVVRSANEADTEVFLNFRVYPGPATDLGHGFFEDPRHGGDCLAPTWAQARMDTARTSAGLHPGRYSSYYWPNGQATPANSKIIPDDVLTPGTTVEYFFSSRYGSTPGEIRTTPDTTGGFFLEFEILPGYLTDDGEVVAPCHLYVDAFNLGAQAVIEAEGLGPLLGVVVDDDGLAHRGWDRYDYQAAGTDLPAPLARELAGDNGMTKFQSLLYRHILYNTGSLTSEGLRDGDADLLMSWLVTDDFDRWDIDKSLWLSGSGMAAILSRPGRLEANTLLSNFAKVAPVDESDIYSLLTGDPSVCVRVDPTDDRDFPTSGSSYASLRGTGCPRTLPFNVLTLLSDGTGNLVFVDQDAGGEETPYASVSNDHGNPPHVENYRVVLDAFSLELLRSTPDGWSGADCGTDLGAILQRVADIHAFGGVGGLCELSLVDLDVEGAVGGAPVAVTRLLPIAPNPFNPRTTIRYELARSEVVTVRVLDVSGRVVRTLLHAPQDPDTHAITWDGRDDAGLELASGVYWARLSTSTGFRASTKLVLLK